MNSPIEQVLDDLSADRQMDMAQEALAAGLGEAGASIDAGASSSVTDALFSIPVTLQVVIGTARLPISQIAELQPGAVVSLDQKLGTPVTILVNGRDVARGDLFVFEGEDARLGITIREVLPVAKRNSAA